MADLDPSPTLDEVKENFLGTIQVPRTAETYRWALGAFVRFVRETSYAGYDAKEAAPYSTEYGGGRW